MYDPSERSHVVQMNLGLLTAIGLAPAAPEFPIERDRHRDGARHARARGQPLCARQPGRGVAQQAVARRAVRGSGARPRRAARPENHRVLGTRRGSAGAGGRARRGGRGASVAEDIHRRSRGAHSRRRADDLWRHRPDARRRRARHADRRHLRSDPPLAQRPVGAGRHHHLARRVCQCHHLRRCTRERMCLLDVETAEVLDAVERRLAAV